MRTLIEIKKIQNELTKEQAERLNYLMGHLAAASSGVKNKCDKEWYQSINKSSTHLITAIDVVVEIGDELGTTLEDMLKWSNDEEIAFIKEMQKLIAYCRQEKENAPLTAAEKHLVKKLVEFFPKDPRNILEVNDKTVTKR